jgi:DTW domain-containing protein YfiP
VTCPRCLYQTHVCLCAAIPRLDNATRVVIVRHHLEKHRSSNSGRLAHLALANSEIVDHGGPDGPASLPALDGAYLLYPLGEPTLTIPQPRPKQLFVLDATWSQARRMYRKLAAVRGLPVLHVPDSTSRSRVARLRAAPAAGMVSTLEAIARALRLLDGDAIATPLEQLYDLAVERARVTGRLAR